MNKKKNLLNLFTQDTQHNYHIVKTTGPDGHLLYLMKNGLDLNVESLEFKPTSIAEELVKECDVKIEKFAPSIFFTEETDTDELKIKLNFKLYESEDFSKFIDEIKDEYRILEVKDSLLYKNDPEAYKKAHDKEREEHQKELWEEYMNQLKEKSKRREDTLISYNNDLIKLLKEYFESIIEFEKRDFDLTSELDKLLGNIIDEKTWIKINDVPFICRTEVCSLQKDRIDVYLTDNNDYSYTATLRFDKTTLLTENIVRINKGDKLPLSMQDYEFISQLFDVDIANVKEWDFKNHTDRFEYVIDYLLPIFKENKESKEKEFLERELENENENIEE
jgi:hypothetical protein